jgi:hypothetical protein
MKKYGEEQLEDCIEVNVIVWTKLSSRRPILPLAWEGIFLFLPQFPHSQMGLLGFYIVYLLYSLH